MDANPPIEVQVTDGVSLFQLGDGTFAIAEVHVNSGNLRASATTPTSAPFRAFESDGQRLVPVAALASRFVCLLQTVDSTQSRGVVRFRSQSKLFAGLLVVTVEFPTHSKSVMSPRVCGVQLQREF